MGELWGGNRHTHSYGHRQKDTNINNMTRPGLGAGPSDNQTNALTCEWLPILSYACPPIHASGCQPKPVAASPSQWPPIDASGFQPQPVAASSNQDLLVPQLMAAAPDSGWKIQQVVSSGCRTQQEAALTSQMLPVPAIRCQPKQPAGSPSQWLLTPNGGQSLAVAASLDQWLPALNCQPQAFPPNYSLWLDRIMLAASRWIILSI